MKQKFDVTGMTCSACSSRVEKCVRRLDGVKDVSVNLLTNSMQVEYEEQALSDEKIIDAVVHAGYGASVKADGTQTVPGAVSGAAQTAKTNPVEEQMKNMKRRLVLSFVFLIPLMYVSMGHMVGFWRERKMLSVLHLHSFSSAFRWHLLTKRIIRKGFLLCFTERQIWIH